MDAPNEQQTKQKACIQHKPRKSKEALKINTLFSLINLNWGGLLLIEIAAYLFTFNSLHCLRVIK
jgi:hypothetical protein